ncbi:MAG: hypothetical protein CO092_00350 [Candidatus Aenigmarchaeota archaeon CG_4_9_14_3_um_filter_37_18]|nr:MAG: hypothetical protein CO092_00350 [Candidatus Aenigmarchaeota archaeon CG_4_9_14_3_um_filter_37_18]
MKGQMSLQMIVGLTILLVVAVVVIRIFLTRMAGMDGTGGGIDDKMAITKFEAECERLCGDYLYDGSNAKLAKYCYTNMTGNTDLNRNGKTDTFPANTKILNVCEDMIYCFHVVSCEKERGVVGWDDCRKAVCEEYVDAYGDETKADQKVREMFPGAGDCDIPKEENWWYMYFGDYPCSNPPRDVYLKSCIYDSGNNQLTCETNCKFTQGNSVYFAVVYGLNKFEAEIKDNGDMMPSTSITFQNNKIIVKTIPPLSDPNLDKNAKANWQVNLICNDPKGATFLTGVG